MAGFFARVGVFIAMFIVVVGLFPAGIARAGGGAGGPWMQLDEAHGEVATVPSSVDAVSSSAGLAGTWGFWAQVQNHSGADVTNAMVSIDSGYPATGFASAGQSFAAFPVSLSQASLADGGTVFLDLRQSPLPVSGPSGFESSRSVDQLNVPLTGLQQTTTVSFTLTDPAYGTPNHYLKLTIESRVPGATLVTLVAPPLVGAGDSVTLFPGPNGGQFVLSSGVLGHTYVFAAILNIPNPFGVVFAHKPQVDVLSANVSAPVCVACGPQTSASLAEPILDGGTPGSGAATASVDQSLPWMTAYTQTYTVDYASTDLPVAPTPPCDESWLWSYTHQFAPGAWSEGEHSYDQRSVWKGVTSEYHVTFAVDSSAPLHDGHVRLGPFGLRSIDGGLSVINPGQATFMQLSDSVLRAQYDRTAVQAVAAGTPTEFRWDGGPWHEIQRSPITNRCAGAGHNGYWMRDGGAGIG
ncbi:MAG TPA: hypothetical protein VKR80_05850 [Candidatus Limnocylindria bacterium]|nr:hypothetical protein [Candidatus Limnocylindria bacterium]